MKAKKIGYYVSTGLLTALMLMSAGMYIFNNAEITKAFESFGFPTYIIYPLAAAKILGLVAIWTKLSTTLKEWAYAGFFFNFTLAAAAHIMIGDGEQGGAIVALILLFTSYFLDRAVFGKSEVKKELESVA
ncbi:DoxX family protein [Sediminitomix flava]|uniref:DoxX-like protein n=1 Tax=Sediminitomix flava TaxID=379075 RepID=A0A315Z8R9_SEDFL|nr:DoxX family protein [Sediminitomix flava]PWJ40090.1 DoxX-like protein [Sediminitomix flava]